MDDPDRVDAAVSRDRAALAASLTALRQRISVQGLAQGVIGDGLDILRHGGCVAWRTADRAVRANPIAVALTVAGLAWLVLGHRSGAKADPQPAPDPALAGSRFEAMSRWEDEGGPVHPAAAPVGAADDADDWMADALGAETRARAALAALERAAKGALQPAADIARDKAAVMADRAADLARSFRKGLDGLSDAAQDRVAKAREAVFGARDVPSLAARLGGDNPTAVGVLSLVFGAALAAALPTAAAEKRVFAATRAHLLARARQLLDDERRRAAGIASDLADGLRDDLDFATARVADAAEALVHPQP